MNTLHTYTFPEAKNIIICGDIHGEFKSLIYKGKSMQNQIPTWSPSWRSCWDNQSEILNNMTRFLL